MGGERTTLGEKKLIQTPDHVNSVRECGKRSQGFVSEIKRRKQKAGQTATIDARPSH